MENYIIIAVVAVVIGLAARYVIRAKKRGQKCIGCPGGCSTKQNENGCACCSCGCNQSKEQ